MAVAPHAFFTAIGPFGARNDHYVRDVATFNAALGVGLLVAVRRPSWRVPVLAITTVQFALHSVNHLVDIGRRPPGWVGYFDFFALAVGTLQLAWLLWLAARAHHRGARPEQPWTTNSTRRSTDEGRIGRIQRGRPDRSRACCCGSRVARPSS